MSLRRRHAALGVGGAVISATLLLALERCAGPAPGSGSGVQRSAASETSPTRFPLAAAPRLPDAIAPARAPAVPIDQSITRDHIVCLEDGKPLRMLKRYLMSQYGMTPDDYRRKWGLPADYPMMAPAVSDQRREAAVRNGLGKSAGGRG